MKARSLEKSNLDVPIPGTTTLQHLEENLLAANVELTANELAEIERAAVAIPIEGERYTE